LGREYAGAVNDFLGIVSEDFEGHGMTYVRTNANKVAFGFTRFGGKGIVMNLVVDFFPPMKM
jgi:hypothetical protein